MPAPVASVFAGRMLASGNTKAVDPLHLLATRAAGAASPTDNVYGERLQQSVCQCRHCIFPGLQISAAGGTVPIRPTTPRRTQSSKPRAASSPALISSSTTPVSARAQFAQTAGSAPQILGDHTRSAAPLGCRPHNRSEPARQGRSQQPPRRPGQSSARCRSSRRP